MQKLLAVGGNQVEYFLPVKSQEWTKRRVLLGAFSVLAMIAVALLASRLMGFNIGSAIIAALTGSALFGLNTVAYETPVTGATAPTAVQASTHQTVGAVVTGDGAATAFTVTHNFGLNAAQLAAGWPQVNLEVILAAGNTAAAIITSKTANAVVFSCTAFTGAGLRVTCNRPWSPTT